MEQRVEIPFREILVLSERLKKEPGYYAPRLEPELLQAALHEHRAVVEWHDGHIEGIAVLWTSNRPQWWELGTVWVGEGLRGRGLHKRLMARAIELTPGIDLFLFSKIEKIQQTAQSLGFEPITTQKHRVLWWASEVGVVCRLPGSIHPSRVSSHGSTWGTPTQGERWLFWRQS